MALRQAWLAMNTARSAGALSYSTSRQLVLINEVVAVGLHSLELYVRLLVPTKVSKGMGISILHASLEN
jgi:hypothetical protein